MNYSITPPPLTKILEYIGKTQLKGMIVGLPLTPDLTCGPFSGQITPTTIAKVIREQTMMIDYYLAPKKIHDHLILTTLRECQTEAGLTPENFILAVCEEGQCHTLEETQAAADAMMMWQANPLAGMLMSKICGDIPTEVSEVPGRGLGLVAKRDINIGEVVALYPVDWAVMETDFEPARDDNQMPNAINAICGDQAKWGNIQALAFGIGNDNEPENKSQMVSDMEKNEGITTPLMREYGLNLDAPGAEKKNARTCVWADPRLEHTNPWMMAHMVNDGLFKPGMTVEQYIKVQKSFTKNYKSKAAIKKEATTMTLGLVCRARKKIQKGDEVVTHYGADYWFSGQHANMVSLEGEAKEACLRVDADNEKKKNEFVKDWKIDMINIHMRNMAAIGFTGTQHKGLGEDEWEEGIVPASEIQKMLLAEHQHVGFCLRDNRREDGTLHATKTQVPCLHYQTLRL